MGAQERKDEVSTFSVLYREREGQCTDDVSPHRAAEWGRLSQPYLEGVSVQVTTAVRESL